MTCLERHWTARALFALGIALCSAGATGGAVASDALPKSGDFSLRYTLVNPTTSVFGPVARGEDASAGISGAGDWIAWLVRSDGADGFGHEMTGKCTEFYRTGAAGYELVVGNCIYTDVDGDKLFESFDGFDAAWTGGTGKYAGLTGAFKLTDITVTVESGYEMQSGVKVGSYDIK